MLDISGAGAQLPMRSHGKLRPGPQSHRNSEQQCKRIRANTASSNASATGQTQSQQTAKQALQGKRPSNRSSFPRSSRPAASIWPCCLKEGRGRAALQEDLFRPHHRTTRPPLPLSPREARMPFLLPSRVVTFDRITPPECRSCLRCRHLRIPGKVLQPKPPPCAVSVPQCDGFVLVAACW